MHGGYGYGSGWHSRDSGSSGPKDSASAQSVKDYATADAYLGSKVDRPLQYATRLQRVRRDRRPGELAGAGKGIAVVHHNQAIVVWRADGMTEFYVYDSVTTRNRLNHYLLVRLYRDRGNLNVWYGWDDKRSVRTPRDVRKCRSCKATGKRGETWCSGQRRWTSYHREENCYRIDAHREHYYGPRTVPCDDCKGLGARDYGSRPIGFSVEHGEWYLLTADGTMAGHLASRGGRWSAVPAPPKPIKVRNRRGEVIAYRGWRAQGNGMLRPLGVDAAAYESFNLPAATCLLADTNHYGMAPAVGCSCGYWAMKDPADVPPSAEVYGQVRIWGRYSEHRIGYRAEHMAVDYLVVSPAPYVREETAAAPIARTIAARYPDVPVYVAEWPLTVPVRELLPVTDRPTSREE